MERLFHPKPVDIEPFEVSIDVDKDVLSYCGQVVIHGPIYRNPHLQTLPATESPTMQQPEDKE